MSLWADAIAYGTHAARPAAGLPGRVYCESDTGVIVRDNGVSWDTVAGGPAPPSTFSVHSTAVDYTIPSAGYLVVCTTAGLTITLPDAAASAGQSVEVFTGAYNNTLAGAGSDEIAQDTTSTATYVLAEGGLTLRSDGTQWCAVGGW